MSATAARLLTTAVPPSLVRVAPRVRPNVDAMSSTQLASFRQAFSGAMGVNDDRGFQHQAGIHGLPLPMYCTHGSPLFLPWHRAYLYFFELALQDQVAGVSLPWWDWTSAASHQHGLPAAYTDTSGNNPLTGSAINAQAVQQGPSVGIQHPPTHTNRSPSPVSELPTPADVTSVLALGDFLDFSTQVEQIHNNVHVWVGGTMSEIPLAAYDPVFWAHHTMIDRLWRLWQLKHPTAGVPSGLMNEALPPFPMTVSQTLSVTTLGYDYATAVARLPIPIAKLAQATFVPVPGPDPGPEVPGVTQVVEGGAAQ
ncbi:MAG TPA: tyrosinase family protein [Actinomycetota bacterium]|nr:tyrosinase family protein [Actinomycetota bacterium]